MLKAVAAEIYRKHCTLPIRYDDLPAGFDYSVLDAAINSGFGRVLPWASKALGHLLKSIDNLVTAAKLCNDKVASGASGAPGWRSYTVSGRLLLVAVAEQEPG